MAKGVPYQRFNNLQKKITVEDYLGRQIKTSDKNNPEFNKILKAVLNRNIKFGVDSLTHHELEGLKPTLGFEIETVMGRLDPEDYQDLNIKAVFDGSLRGPNGEDPTGAEYVTNVLYGDAGFKHLYDICKVLNQHCDIDHRSGIHIHIGSLNWKEEDIVFAYILAMHLEKEVFSMLPKSRRNNPYCRPITKLFNRQDLINLKDSMNRRLEYEVIIKQLYEKVFREVSGGTPPSDVCNGYTNHPKGSKCGYDKNSQRYCWINFVTLIFNTKDNIHAKTLEIRNHSATLNYYKIRNWTKIWVAFTNYVSNHKKDILDKILTDKSFGLEEIILTTYKKSGKKLVEYMESRKELFTTADESVEYSSEIFSNKSIKQVLEV